MKKVKITTPENIEVEYALAGLGSRTAAAFIDSLIQIVMLLILGVSLLLMAQNAPDFWETYYGWIIGIALIIFALISYGYYIAMELTTNGQTLGKKVLRLRTIRNNGQSITLKHSAIRNLFKMFIDIFGVGPVFMFFNKEYKRVGDLAASTIVVAEDQKEAPITLEHLMRNNSIDYYISKEESQILRDYYNRKGKLESYEDLRNELKNHFTKKFQELGILEEQKSFIDSL